MSFSALAPLWEVVAPPLRPSAEDLRVYSRHVRGRLLVLGATQELMDLSPTALGVDLCAEMVARVRGRMVVGNWCELPIEDGSVDTILGDGSLSAVGEADTRRQVLAEVRRVLAPGGRVVLRSYTQGAQAEGPGGADPGEHERGINALKVALWGRVAQGDGRVALADVWRAWSGLPEATRGKFSPEAVASVECYRDSTASYWVPARKDLFAFVADCGFRTRETHFPSAYALADRCPVMTLEPAS